MELKEKYKTGVFWQDIQHGQLIELFNTTLDSESRDSDPSKYAYTLGFLVMYANQHFNLEEAYMDKYGYPDAGIHKIAHTEFIKDLKEFRQKHKTYTQEAADYLTAYVGSWIQEHLLGNDRKLGEYLLQKEKEVFLKQ